MKSCALSPNLSRCIIEALNPLELKRLLRSRRVSRNSLKRSSEHTRRFSYDGKCNDGSTFSDLEVQELSSLFSESDAAPTWARTLRGYFRNVGHARYEYQPEMSVEENLAIPIAAHAGKRLFAKEQNQIRTLLSDSAWKSLESLLRLRLSSSGVHAVNLEWQIFCTATGSFNGVNTTVSEATLMQLYFADGIERLSCFLLCRNPDLARLWAVQTDFWVATSVEFLRHCH